MKSLHGAHRGSRSDPSSPRFGQYFTVEEVNDIFAPSPSTVKAVQAWLESMGIANITHTDNKQWLACMTRGVLHVINMLTFHRSRYNRC